MSNKYRIDYAFANNIMYIHKKKPKEISQKTQLKIRPKSVEIMQIDRVRAIKQLDLLINEKQNLCDLDLPLLRTESESQTISMSKDNGDALLLQKSYNHNKTMVSTKISQVNLYHVNAALTVVVMSISKDDIGKNLLKDLSYIGGFKFHLKLEEELVNQSRHRYTYRNMIKIGERNNFKKVDRSIQTIQDFSQGQASSTV